MEELSPESKALYELLMIDTKEEYEKRFLDYKKKVLDAMKSTAPLRVPSGACFREPCPRSTPTSTAASASSDITRNGAATPATVLSSSPASAPMASVASSASSPAPAAATSASACPRAPCNAAPISSPATPDASRAVLNAKRDSSKDDLSPEARRVYHYIVGNSDEYVPVAAITATSSASMVALASPPASVFSATTTNETDPSSVMPATCSAEWPSHDDDLSVSVLISSTTKTSSTTIGDVLSELAVPIGDNKALDVDATDYTSPTITICLPGGSIHSISGEDPVHVTPWNVHTVLKVPPRNSPRPPVVSLIVPELFTWSPTCSTNCLFYGIKTSSRMLPGTYMEFSIGSNVSTMAPWPPPSCTRARPPLIRGQNSCHHAQQKRGKELLVSLDRMENWNAIWLGVALKPPWSPLGVCINLPMNVCMIHTVVSLATSPMEYFHGIVASGKRNDTNCDIAQPVLISFEYVDLAIVSAPPGREMNMLLGALSPAAEIKRPPWPPPPELVFMLLMVVLQPTRVGEFQPRAQAFDTDCEHQHWPCFLQETYNFMFSDVAVHSLVHAERGGWFQFCSVGRASLYSYGPTKFQWEIAWPSTTLAYSIHYGMHMYLSLECSIVICYLEIEIKCVPHMHWDPGGFSQHWLGVKTKFRKFAWLLMGSYLASSKSGKSELVILRESMPPLNQLMLNVYHTFSPGTPIEVGLLKDVLVQDRLICLNGHIIPCGFELLPWKIAWTLVLELLPVCSGSCGNYSADLTFSCTSYACARKIHQGSSSDQTTRPWNCVVFLQPKPPWSDIAPTNSVDVADSLHITDVYMEINQFGPFASHGSRLSQVWILYLPVTCIVQCGSELMPWEIANSRNAIWTYTKQVLILDAATGVNWNSTPLSSLKLTWDPGGYRQHPLEGKPDFKEGGLSTTCLSSWLMGCHLGPWPASERHTSTYRSRAATMERGLEQNGTDGLGRKARIG